MSDSIGHYDQHMGHMKPSGVTHVSKVADVPQVSLAAQLLASKSIEQKTLDALTVIINQLDGLFAYLTRDEVQKTPGVPLETRNQAKRDKRR